MPALTSDSVREVLALAGGEQTPGTATLLHALDAAEHETAQVAAVVRCLARAGADGHTVLPLGLLTEMLVGQGASAEQSAAAIAGAVDLGHVLAFGAEESGDDHPDADADAEARPAPEPLLSLAEIGMAEEAVAEGLLSLLATAEVVFADVPHGATVPAGAVDLRNTDVVAAAVLLERAADASRVVLLGDSGLPAPGGPGQLVADLLAVAPEIGLRVETASGGGTVGAVITALCGAVRAGTLAPVDDPTREVVVVRAADGAEAAHRAGQLVTDSLPRALGLSGDDVAVVSPLRRGPGGVDALRAAGLPAFTARAAMGRTWPGVVAVLPPEACGVLSRPLVYAMFTRATRHLSIVHAAGPVLVRAVRETGARPRRTRLPDLLRGGS
ncbi:MAG TPA: hypothetical protein VGO94_12475 [Mycobacteriales bacterium]|nr:hypothetical protein [Mycobacteriales bacterium]